MSTEPKVPDAGQGGEGTSTPEENEAIKKLSEQVENLNKGIASYRDEAQSAKEIANLATEKFDALEERYKELTKKDAEKDLSPEDQKKFESWAKSKGVVTQEELNAQKQQNAQESAKTIATTAVNEFLEKNPEFDDDDMWAKVQEEFALYKTPTDVVGYKKLLDKIKNGLTGGDEGKARAKVKAELTQKQRLALGGKGGNGSGGEDTEARIDSLQEKYPNLSREQIQARISEIDTIYQK